MFNVQGPVHFSSADIYSPGSRTGTDLLQWSNGCCETYLGGPQLCQSRRRKRLLGPPWLTACTINHSVSLTPLVSYSS